MVGQPDPKLLAITILNLTDGVEARKIWSANAVERARADFNQEILRKRFLYLMNGSMN